MVTSRAVVGSSAIKEIRLVGERHGDHHPLALAARELVRVGVEALLGLLQLDEVQKLEGPSSRLGPVQPAMQEQALADLLLDLVQGVERGHRFLEDDPDAVAPDLAKDRLVGADQLLAVEGDAAARVPGLRIGQELQDRERGHRLAGAALADQRHGLALIDRERHLADRLERAAFDLEVDRKVLDPEQAHR